MLMARKPSNCQEGMNGAWPDCRRLAFRDGGSFTFRSGWEPQAVWPGMHCGLGTIDKTKFHSQFDCGTFELMAFGRMLMVDPGVYNYNGGGPGREAFRRIAGHQTPTRFVTVVAPYQGCAASVVGVCVDRECPVMCDSRRDSSWMDTRMKWIKSW